MVYRYSCCVLGCNNKGYIQKHLSFFSVPREPDRRHMWLKLISREDLADKDPREPPRRPSVCEVHFEKSAFFPGQSKRKLLKKHALPILYLPSGSGYQLPTIKDTRDGCCQTGFSMASVASQTEAALPWLPPRTTCPPGPADPIHVKTEDCQDDLEDLYTLHRVCDKFLTKDLADLVKLQAILKLQNKIG